MPAQAAHGNDAANVLARIRPFATGCPKRIRVFSTHAVLMTQFAELICSILHKLLYRSDIKAQKPDIIIMLIDLNKMLSKLVILLMTL